MVQVRSCVRFLGALALGAALSRADAADIVWIGAGGSDWSNGGNWSGGLPPGVGDRPVFTNAAVGKVVNLGGDRTVTGIGFAGASSFTFSGGTLNLAGAVWQQGTGTQVFNTPVVWPSVDPLIDGPGTGEVVFQAPIDVNTRRVVKRGNFPWRMAGENDMRGGLTLGGVGRLRVTANWSIDPGVANSDGIREPLLIFQQGSLKNKAPTQYPLYGLHLATGGSVTVENSVRQAAGSSAVLAVDNGSVLTFQGTWNKRYALAPFEMSAMVVGANSVLRFGADAEINNLQSDLAGTRDLKVVGDGLSAVLDFHEDFEADRTGWDGDPNDPDWRNNGLGSLDVSGVTMRTRRSENLPSVHRRGPGGVHTQHGFLVFTGAPMRWEVLEDGQTFLGGVHIKDNLVIHAVEDLTVQGDHSEVSPVSFGTTLSEAQLTKSGAGALVIDVDQGWMPKSKLRIDAGSVIMHTDPAGGWTGTYPFNFAKKVGSKRTLAVDTGAVFDVRAPLSRIGALSMRAGGRTRIAAGSVLDAVSAKATGASTLEIVTEADGDCGRLVSGERFQPGNMTLALTGTPPAASSLLIATWTVDRVGTFAAVTGLPVGWSVTYDDAARECRVGPATTAEEPAFSPEGGAFVDSIEVAISSSTPDPTIRYTLDGSTPTETSPLYTGPIELTATTTLRARAWADGLSPSPVHQAVFREISPEEPLRINFQPLAKKVPAGYVPDGGLPFAAQPSGPHFGWDADISATAVDRNVISDQVRDTFVQPQLVDPDATWQVELPDGTYTVTLRVGDAKQKVGRYQVRLEGTVAIDHDPVASGKHGVATVEVEVEDGTLDLDCGPDAVGTKLQAIEIVPTAPPAPTTTG